MSILLALLVLIGTSQAQPRMHWRAATQHELELALPARPAVEKDHIEVEMRTASGIINQNKKVIAGVVLITAGYAADGKYSHFLLVQSPFTLGNVHLSAGNYVLGWKRKEDVLEVTVSDAASGTPKGTVVAHRMTGNGRVESFRLWPPDGLSEIQIGRFFIHYSLDES
ncbi:hypothetical protein [Edaphobacter flagellatus]|uniref:hypothetical protein n=1 Tax=Edaphobacter flagellatus TaxID=1933044 RepID=UPI0021B2857F|nr:hypothetical protein [Edaphobacter flagellatus]